MNENDNWTYHIKKNFNTFKNSVITEMVKYYGKKYEDIITQRLDDVNFIFYGTIKNGIPSRKQSFNGRKGVVFRTKEIDYNIDTKESINSDIDSKLICFNTKYDFDKNELNKYILIPLFATDEDIIHEMIHAITYTPLYLDDENEKYKGKTGLAVSNNDGEILLEETITELEAKNIYKLLKKKNSKTFLAEYYDVTSNCYYNHFINLISKFYKYFFNEITYSRITLNKNSLVQRVGKDLYERLTEFIGYYAEDLYSLSKERYIPLINCTVDKMKENYKVKELV